MANKLYVSRAALNAVGMDEARKRVRRVVRRTDARSAVLAPVDNGNLRSNRTSDVTERGLMVLGDVTYHVEYAAAVHNGRRALTIRAKTRAGGQPGYLKFIVNGRTVYARQVRQKARKGRPFLATALREVAGAEGFTVTTG